MLPSQASSVPCEQILSNAKVTPTDRGSHLKAEIFEILQILKSRWRDRFRVGLAEVNDEDLEQCEYEFMNFLIAEEEWDSWEQEESCV